MVDFISTLDQNDLTERDLLTSPHISIDAKGCSLRRTGSKALKRPAIDSAQLRYELSALDTLRFSSLQDSATHRHLFKS